jgi:hypothetical protein
VRETMVTGVRDNQQPDDLEAGEGEYVVPPPLLAAPSKGTNLRIRSGPVTPAEAQKPVTAAEVWKPVESAVAREPDRSVEAKEPSDPAEARKPDELAEEGEHGDPAKAWG